MQGLLKSEQFIIAPMSLVLFCFLPEAFRELQYLRSEPLLTKALNVVAVVDPILVWLWFYTEKYELKALVQKVEINTLSVHCKIGKFMFILKC